MEERPSREGVCGVSERCGSRQVHTHDRKELVPAGHTAFPHIMVQKVILREEKRGEVAWASGLRVLA